MIVLGVLFALLVVILIYRNDLVCKARLKANDISYQKIGDWDIYNNGDSYDKQLYCFWKWKFEHFYPELKSYL